MRNFKLDVLAVLSALFIGEAHAEPVIVTEPFIENFDRLSPVLWYISDGWSNGSHQNCTWSKRALAIPAGKSLQVLFVPDGIFGDAAYCGELQTRRWFKYGTFEARIRTQHNSGLNAAFFTYTGAVHKQPHDEIDFEILTKGPGMVWLNRYVGGDDLGQGEVVRVSDDPWGYNDYAFIWEQDRIRWFINGELVREVTDHIPTHRMKVYFSHWGSDAFVNWMGPYERPDGPVAMEVERFAYTPEGVECAFPESILCKLP